MVDRDIVERSNKNRSLSADSDLHSAYESFRKGDYKGSLLSVEKKIPKLNSQIDKFNFNILLSLIYSKTNRLEDSNKLCETLKSEMIKYDYFNSFPEICSYFKTTLRELNQDKILKEIFDYSTKNINLTKIDQKEQKNILKELTLNYELNDLYSKINIFLKNENDPDLDLLYLIKYEVVYILCFKTQKLSKFIGSAIFKEMVNKYESLKSKKGFLDIFIKFLIGLNDTENFIKLYENKNYEFTNAPVEDLLINIYFNQKNNEEKLINYLVNSIRTNLDKCNFNHYSRLIRFVINFLQENLKITKLEISQFDFIFGEDLNLIFSDSENFEKFAFNNSLSFKENYQGLLSFLFYIKENKDIKEKYFNSYKSSILAILMYLHLIVIIFEKNLNLEKLKNIENKIFSLIFELLENSINKQSILMEVSKYFLYLNEEKRKIILDKFSYNQTLLFNDTILTNDDKEKIIFYQKINKILNLNLSKNIKYISSNPNNNEGIESLIDDLENYINEITNIYFLLTKNSKNIEKGERLLGDDLIILMNETIFEFLNNTNLSNFSNISIFNDKLSNLIYKCYALDLIAYDRSPYNYDISLFYLRICGYLGLNTKVLNILTTMNLKGPQFETVSYIAHKFFFNSQNKLGLVYLNSHLDKWHKDNKRCARKTLWKMFTGRNFWDTEEINDFIYENENSYYKVLNDFHELTINNVNQIILTKQESLKRQELVYIFEGLKFNQKLLENKIENKTLIKNQDVVINIFKFKNIPYLDNNFDELNSNKNFSQKNFIFKYPIDSLMKNNKIFENTPGYKNNFFLQDDTSVYGYFENENFLNLSFLTNILKINLKFHFEDFLNKENKDSKTILPLIDLDQNYIKDIIKKSEILINAENEVKMCELNRIDKEEFCFIFNLEKILVLYFKFEFENNLNSENLETNINILSDILNKFNDLILKSYDFANFKNNYKTFNQISKNNLLNRFRIFSRFYLPSLILISAKINNYVNINKNLFKNPTALRNLISSNFKSPVLNFLINMEILTNDSDEVSKIESYLNVKEFNEFNNLPNKTKIQMKKLTEENTKEIKEISKSLSSFLRDLI